MPLQATNSYSLKNKREPRFEGSRKNEWTSCPFTATSKGASRLHSAKPQAGKALLIQDLSVAKCRVPTRLLLNPDWENLGLSYPEGSNPRLEPLHQVPREIPV